MNTRNKKIEVSMDINLKTSFKAKSKKEAASFAAQIKSELNYQLEEMMYNITQRGGMAYPVAVLYDTTLQSVSTQKIRTTTKFYFKEKESAPKKFCYIATKKHTCALDKNHVGQHQCSCGSKWRLSKTERKPKTKYKIAALAL